MHVSRDQFLSLPSRPTAEVDVPGLGLILLRSLSAGERDAFEADHLARNGRDFRARLVAATACDDQGARIFAAADVLALSALPAATLEPIVKAAVKLNALGEQDVEDLKKKS